MEADILATVLRCWWLVCAFSMASAVLMAALCILSSQISQMEDGYD